MHTPGSGLPGPGAERHHEHDEREEVEPAAAREAQRPS
jgi:hypothetical protein